MANEKADEFEKVIAGPCLHFESEIDFVLDYQN
jgi:hypothetical protein